MSVPVSYYYREYVLKFVSDLQQVMVFSWYPVYSTNKTDCHDITEILLKVALNTNKIGFLASL
jgi:hypothetical protein